MKNIYWVIVIIVLAGASFFGGMKYAQNQQPNNFANFRNLTPEQRQQQLQRAGMPPNLGSGIRGGATNGEVISKDEKSITVKLRDGGSRIVFYSPNTTTSKSIDGSINDIQVGTSVMVNGTSNADGSVTAQNIQIRSTTLPLPTILSTPIQITPIQ